MRADHGRLAGALATEVVVSDVFWLHSEVIQHLEDGSVHHWRTADVVLNVFRSGVLAEVVLKQDLVNESNVSIPVVLFLWFRESNIELEVREILFDLAKVIDVKQFTKATATVPITNFAIGLLAFEEFEYVASKWGHPSTTTDVNHFGLGVLDEELAIGGH